MIQLDGCWLGEIHLFAGAFEPDGFLFCDGQLLNITEHEDLYSLIGNTWGGDNVKTFALPDLRGRLPIGQGHGPDLTDRVIAQTGGTETVTLTVAEMPAHSHPFNAVSTPATTTQIGNTVLYAATKDGYLGYVTNGSTPAPTPAVLAPSSIGSNGGGHPHDNVMPCIALNYIICVEGLYPTRA
ncbi:MAG: tail fiber protein [Rhodospirillaceae bacterium]